MIITVGILPKVSMLHLSIGWNAKTLVSPLSAKPFQSTHLSWFGISNFLCTIKLLSDQINSEPYLYTNTSLNQAQHIDRYQHNVRAGVFETLSPPSSVMLQFWSYTCAVYSCPCMTHFHIFDSTSLKPKSSAASRLASNILKEQVRGWSVCCFYIYSYLPLQFLIPQSTD